MKKTKTQTCRLCGETKKLELFEIDKRVKGGRTTRCKACKSKLNDKARSLYSSLKYRSKQDGQPLEVTLKELRSLFAVFDGKCIYCDATEEETGKPHHIDHIVAASKGGRHHVSNLVLSCASCNKTKANLPFFEFYKRKRAEISDDNFTTLLHYVAITSGQPLKDVFASFAFEYVRDNYGHLLDSLDLDEEEIKKQAKKELTRRAL